MKKTIEVTYLIEQTIDTEEEVEFPIYRMAGELRYNNVIYTKINADLSAIHITVNNCGENYEIQFEKEYGFYGEEADFHFGRNDYALKKSVFETIVSEMKQKINLIQI